MKRSSFENQVCSVAEALSRFDRLLAIPPVGSAVAAVVLNVAGTVLSVPPVRQFVDRSKPV